MDAAQQAMRMPQLLAQWRALCETMAMSLGHQTGPQTAKGVQKVHGMCAESWFVLAAVGMESDILCPSILHGR